MTDYLKHNDEEELDIDYTLEELFNRDDTGWVAGFLVMNLFANDISFLKELFSENDNGENK